MPLFLVVSTSAIAYYMGYRHVNYRNYREFRIQLLVLCSKKANSVIMILHLLYYILRWLPVKYSIDFKALLLTFETIHGLAPPYISELISVKDTNGRNSLRSNNGILLTLPTCKSLTTLGDRSFSMVAPKLWSNLPLFIRNIFSVNNFKKSFKTHLFQKAFLS